QRPGTRVPGLGQPWQKFVGYRRNFEPLPTHGRQLFGESLCEAARANTGGSRGGGGSRRADRDRRLGKGAGLELLCRSPVFHRRSTPTSETSPGTGSPTIIPEPAAAFVAQVGRRALDHSTGDLHPSLLP